MFLLQEHLDLVHGVPEHGLQAGAGGGEVHGKDPVSDVGEVQVIPIVDISSLVIAYKLLDHFGF